MMLMGRPPCRFRNAWEGTASPAIRTAVMVCGLAWMRCGSAGPLAEPVPLDRCLPGDGFLCLGDLLADAPRGTRRARSWRYRLWVLMGDLWPWQGAR